ncbi:MAG: hypothetical protein HOQ24_01635, partial [Mycobacteriaceae bacterium]|nr:hypothetical protein [Mycobacteriaceae bacterium]
MPELSTMEAVRGRSAQAADIDPAEPRERGVAVLSAAPGPVDEEGLRNRLAITGLSAVQALLAIPALALWVLSVLSIALAPLGIGIVLANAVVPATEMLANAHRRLAGYVLGERIQSRYANTAGRGPIGRAAVWFRDPARWREFGYLAFSATGGFTLSLAVAVLLATPVVHLVALILIGGWLWFWLVVGVGPVVMLVWWYVARALVRARAVVDRAMLGSAAAELRAR